MKKVIRISVSLLVVVMAVSSLSFGQEYLKLTESKSLQFENETEKAEVKFLVSSKYNFLKIEIDSHLLKGEAAIELIDPNGAKQGNLTVKTQSTKSKVGEGTRLSEIVYGNMEKSIRNPKNGEWMLRVTPKSKTRGQVTIKITQIYNSKTNVLELEDIEKEDKQDKGGLPIPVLMQQMNRKKK